MKICYRAVISYGADRKKSLTEIFLPNLLENKRTQKVIAATTNLQWPRTLSFAAFLFIRKIQPNRNRPERCASSNTNWWPARQDGSSNRTKSLNSKPEFLRLNYFGQAFNALFITLSSCERVAPPAPFTAIPCATVVM